MKKNFILMMLSTCLLSLFVFSSCGGDKEEPKNDLSGKTFVARNTSLAKGYSEELYFVSASKVKVSIKLDKLPDNAFNRVEDLDNLEGIKEQLTALVEDGKFNNIPIYFKYKYNEQTGAITLEMYDSGISGIMDLMAKNFFPIILASQTEGLVLSELQKTLALEGMRKEVKKGLKKAIEISLNAVQSIVYKKDEAKIYLTAINPLNQESEIDVFVQKK